MCSHDVTLYMLPGSCAIVPHILLHQAGIQFKLSPVHVKSLTTDFAATNPKKQVPVLAVDGEMITENPAIAHMINQLAPNAKIMGTGSLQFIRVCEWLNWLSGTLHAQTWGPYARPWRFTNDPAAEASVKAKSEEKLFEKFEMIESSLPSEGWALGETFTAVDAYLLPISQWAGQRMGVDLATKYPKWTRLVERLHGMESVKVALAEEKKINEDGGPGAFF